MDPGFRRGDGSGRVSVIPAKAGIHPNFFQQAPISDGPPGGEISQNPTRGRLFFPVRPKSTNLYFNKINLI